MIADTFQGDRLHGQTFEHTGRSETTSTGERWREAPPIAEVPPRQPFYSAADNRAFRAYCYDSRNTERLLSMLERRITSRAVAQDNAIVCIERDRCSTS